MRRSLIPEAGMGAILLAAFGATTVGRTPKRRPAPQLSSNASADAQNAHKVKSDVSPCGVNNCVDPAVYTRQLATSEGAMALRESICGFLIEYEAPDVVSSERWLRADSRCTLQECEFYAAARSHLGCAGPIHTQLALSLAEQVR